LIASIITSDSAAARLKRRRFIGEMRIPRSHRFVRRDRGAGGGGSGITG
jgi:hypothetical protein